MAPPDIFERGCISCEIGVSGVRGPIGCDVCGGVVVESINRIVGVETSTLSAPVV